MHSDPNKLIVPDKHTPEMIRGELLTMLGIRPNQITLGNVLCLHLANLLVYDGEKFQCIDPQEAEKMIAIPAAEIQQRIDAAFAVYELIPEADLPAHGKHSDYGMFSPEWLADTLAMASRSIPALTISQMLWELPLVTVLHLALADFRHSGGITRRPDNAALAIKMYYGEKNNGN